MATDLNPFKEIAWMVDGIAPTVDVTDLVSVWSLPKVKEPSVRELLPRGRTNCIAKCLQGMQDLGISVDEICPAHCSLLGDTCDSKIDNLSKSFVGLPGLPPGEATHKLVHYPVARHQPPRHPAGRLRLPSVTVLTICIWYLQTNMVTHSIPLHCPSACFWRRSVPRAILPEEV